MKKLVSMLLLVALAATLLVGSAFAAETDPDLKIGTNSAKAGEEVVLTVDISGVAVTGGKVFFNIPSQLTYVKTTSSACIVVDGDGGFGFMCVAEASSLSFNVTFKVASDAAAGTYDVGVKLDVSEAKNVNNNAWAGSYNVTAGSVTVEGAPVACNHVNTEIRNAKDATCTEKGYTGDTWCKDCENTIAYGEEIPAKGHTPVTDNAVAATCTEAGKTEGSHCSVCGEVLVAQEVIPATGHDWDEGEVTTDPGCTTKGVKTFTCKNDASHTKTEDIDPTGHKWGEWTDCDADPDCEHKGCHERVCSVCRATEDKEHTYDESKWSAWVKSDDGKTETRTNACTVCGHEISETQDVKEEQPVNPTPTPAPTDKPDSKPDNKPDNSKKDDTKKAPKTGDESNLALWASVLLVACGSAVVVMTKKKEN